MKKFLSAILLIALMCVGLASCAEENAEEDYTYSFSDPDRMHSKYNTGCSDLEFLGIGSGIYTIGEKLTAGVYVFSAGSDCSDLLIVTNENGEVLQSYDVSDTEMWSVYVKEGQILQIPEGCEIRALEYDPQPQETTPVKIKKARYFTNYQLMIAGYTVKALDENGGYIVIYSMDGTEERRVEVADGEVETLNLMRLTTDTLNEEWMVEIYNCILQSFDSEG